MALVAGHPAEGQRAWPAEAGRLVAAADQGQVTSRHSELKSGIARSCRLLGGCALSKLGTGHEGRGWPDLYLAHREGPRGGFWLEVKVGRDRPSDEQLERARLLEAGGAGAMFLWERGAGAERSWGLLDAEWRPLESLRVSPERGPGFLELARLARRLLGE